MHSLSPFIPWIVYLEGGIYRVSYSFDQFEKFNLQRFEKIINLNLNNMNKDLSICFAYYHMLLCKKNTTLLSHQGAQEALI